MEFLTERVYTALNADELKVGSKVVVADNITNLKEKIERDEIRVLTAILTEDEQYRFRTARFVNDPNVIDFGFAYLVEEPEENKLKWQDVQIGDVLYRKASPDVQFLVTAKSFNPNTDKHIFAADAWIFDPTLSELYDKVEEN